MGRWLVVAAVAVLGACAGDDGGAEDAGYPATDGHRESQWEQNCGAELCGRAWCDIHQCEIATTLSREMCMEMAHERYRAEDRLGVLSRCLNDVQSDSLACSAYWTGPRAGDECFPRSE